MPEIQIDKIIPDPDQPRQSFDDTALKELAASIQANGLQQAIKVRPVENDQYKIVLGERRWRAHKLLKAKTIRAEIEAMDDVRAGIAAIIENLQREDITPIEEAIAFKRMLDRGISERDLAKRLGISQHWRIRQRVHLLNLDNRYRAMLERGDISRNAAYEIARLSKSDQTLIIKQISSGSLRTDTDVYTAVQTLLSKDAELSMFAKTDADEAVKTLAAMGRKVERIRKSVGKGFKADEAKIGAAAGRQKTDKMADQIALITKTLLAMEQELRAAGIQSEMTGK